MSTHATALGTTALAYALSRRHAEDGRYSFGAWKIEVLGGFASAVALAMVALYMAAESASRILQPHVIYYDQALLVAVVGLFVNLACAALLSNRHAGHNHHHESDRAHSDLNLRSAYVHVLADAMTSVLAIAALIGGKLFRWGWLDPAMGIVGAVIVSTWAFALIRDTSRVLLDREMDLPIVDAVRHAIESDGDSRVTDLHLVRVGRQRFACIVSVVTGTVREALDYKSLLRGHEELAHLTVEVARCREHAGPA